MTTGKPRQRLGFFTRLLDEAPPAERYRLATQQMIHAEQLGFDAVWVAQHHLHGAEGGLPSPFVFLAHVAACTSRVQLGTAIVTLPLELPLRVAEDAAVVDIMSGGRLEVGVAPGGNLATYTAFGLDSNERHALMNRHLDVLRDAWAGRPLPGGDCLYPPDPGLADRIWQATFSIEGAQRAGRAGDGLMLSRNQPQPYGATRRLTLEEIQNPMIDAYLEALPPGREPRILASRTVFVVDDRKDGLRLVESGFQRARAAGSRRVVAAVGSVEETVAELDLHTGTPEDVIASLGADSALARATDWSVQVHGVDPPHPYIMRSIELVAKEVAPALGWKPAASD